MRIFPKGVTEADVQARVDAAVAALLDGASFTGQVQAPSVKVEPPPGPDFVTNGNFTTSGNWTFGSGWVWTAGAAHKNASGSATVSQASVIPYADGQRYFRVKFTVFDRTAGTVTPLLAGCYGTAVSSNGDHEQMIPVSWAGGSVAFEPSYTARLKITNVEVREVFPGVEMSQQGILPSVSHLCSLGSSERTFNDINARDGYVACMHADSVEASWQIRGDRLIAFSSYSYTPGEFILGSGWSHGDWRLRVNDGDLVFEQYDDGVWDWIEKHRIPVA